MHPLLAERQRLLAYITVWELLAVLLAGLLALTGNFSWTEALALALPLSFFYGFACLGAFWVCQSAPLGKTSLARLAGAQAAAAALSACLLLLASRAWAELLDWTGLFPQKFTPRAAAAGPLLLGMGIVLYLLVAALHYLLAAFEESRRAEAQALEFQILSRDAELRALRAQIHPHFLFNSLNSISALTGTNPEGARRMCVLLADFLRTSLTLGAKDRIPLSEEVGLAEGLLAIERVRFGPRLACVRRVEEDALPCLVPPLLLQPLVENAVTHGLAQLIDGGTVTIEGRRRGGRLELAVENPRDPEVLRRKGTGVGLDNVRRRLAALYGHEGGLDIRDDGKTFRVEVSLPARLSPAP
jgi:two-component system, LytTR family, sensor histidine kinase AlgZ